MAYKNNNNNNNENKAMKEYRKMAKLGEGTYGVVYEAEHVPSKTTVALKKIKIDANEEGIPATTLREISLLKELQHPCIIPLLRSIYEHGELYLVFEYMTCDLKQYLDKSLKEKEYLTLIKLKQLSYYLIEGVRYCHAHRILHRDLKPQNILIDIKNNIIKIGDFGLGREHGLPITKLTHEVVTLWYRPPEILLDQEKYSGACDIWGVACIIAEMATKRPLFPGDSEIDQLFQIFQILGTPDDQVWPGVSKLTGFQSNFPKWKGKGLSSILNDKIDNLGIELVSLMLIYPSNQRITAKAALKHAWFDQVRCECDLTIEKFMKSMQNHNYYNNQKTTLQNDNNNNNNNNNNNKDKNKENININNNNNNNKNIDSMDMD